MNNWSFFNPTQIDFGAGGIENLNSISDYQRILLITTPGFSKRGVVRRIQNLIGSRLIQVYDGVNPNPDIDYIDSSIPILKRLKPDCLIALGGGSAIDTAKAFAKLLHENNNLTLAEHFRNKTPFTNNCALPIFAIPTTAGTGSEVTPFATIWDFQKQKKYSLTGRELFPKKAFLDPELTLDLPELQTVSGGLDTISHALESIWNKNANHVTIGIATQSLKLSLNILPQLKKDPKNLELRGVMMESSVLAGLAISQTRTALAHSISYPLTLNFNLPHGVACSFMLPELLRYNMVSAGWDRLNSLSHDLGCQTTEKFAERIEKLFFQLDMQQIISNFIPDTNEILALTPKMITPGRAENNIRQYTQYDIQKIVARTITVLPNKEF